MPQYQLSFFFYLSFEPIFFSNHYIAQEMKSVCTQSFMWKALFLYIFFYCSDSSVLYPRVPDELTPSPPQSGATSTSLVVTAFSKILVILIKMASEQLWILTEQGMHNADTGDILYDDSMHSNTKSQDSIDFITYLINILHCQHHTPLCLSLLILAKHRSKLLSSYIVSVLIRGSVQQVTIQRRLLLDQSKAETVSKLTRCALAAESHLSHDLAETNSTHNGHFLLSFDIPAQLP